MSAAGLSARARAELRALARDVAHPGPPPPGWPAAAGIVLGGTLGGIAVVLLLGASHYGRASAYFAEGRGGTWFSAAVFAAAGLLAMFAAARMGWARGRRFWAVAGLALVYLGADDAFAIHEAIDLWIHRMLGWNPRHPLTDHLDDVIVLGYGLFCFAWSRAHWPDIRRLRWAATTGVAAAAAAVAMVVCDVGSLSEAAEESLKTMAGALAGAAALAAALDPARRGQDSSTAS